MTLRIAELGAEASLQGDSGVARTLHLPAVGRWGSACEEGAMGESEEVAEVEEERGRIGIPWTLLVPWALALGIGIAAMAVPMRG